MGLSKSQTNLTATVQPPAGTVTPARFRRIRQVFESMLDLTRGRRNEALRDLRRNDPELAGEVEELFSAYSRRDGFLEQPPAAVRERRPSLAGTTIGAYRMLHLVGEGGMGEVWCAEQQFPVKRRVAVKLIKAGMDTNEVVARFEAERQALAMMEHPAIAKVFHAGSTSEGRPYFAMEYVEGVPLTTYCDRYRLSIRERLKLFIRVCEGVQHAHQKAIIHRDLKPSNILVLEVDGKPVPKIIDFGVARATSRGLAEETALTRAGAILGTPNYMSPEQAGPAGEDIDTRTDVYSLGVILYELLTGALPFDFRRLALDEILRALREADAPRPSARFRGLPDQEVIAGNLRTAPDKLLRRLRGDLDAITLNALEKERSRRYGTPSQLAADIERHLRNEPVSARTASVPYRARKYFRRHYAAVSVSALGVLLLLSGGIVETVQLRRITRERDRADRIANLMIGMFKVSDPGESRGNSVTAREILDKASREIETGLARDPLRQAQMLEVMGSVYSSLGLYREAEPLLTRALGVHRRLLGAENAITAQSMSALANTLHSEGRLQEAVQLDQEAFDVRRRVLGPEHPDTLVSMNHLARHLVREGKYREAEQLHRTVLEIRRRVLGPEHPDTLTSLDNLGNTLDEEGRYAEAERLEREALSIKRRVLGENHPETLRALHHLADTLYGEGRAPEAGKLHRAELSEYLRVLGGEHRDTLNAMIALANALDDEGKYGEAEALVRQALDTERRVLGTEHRDTLIAMNNLAEILGDAGRYPEAETLHREVLASRTKVLGPEHAHTLYSVSKLAWILLLSGRLDEAEKLSREAWEAQGRVLGPDHPDTAETAYNLACIAARRGRATEALSMLRNAIDHGLKPRAVLRIGADGNWAPLHRNADFVALVAYARQRAAVSGVR